jgi:HPt (histidine-containing phosphotransfer) domain-containing protein
MSDHAIPEIDDEAQADLRDALGDEDFDRLVGIFCETLPLRMQEIRQALESGDSTAFSRASHAMKGAAANLGYSGLANLFSQMEAKGKSGLLDGAADMYAATHRGVAATFPDLVL